MSDIEKEYKQVQADLKAVGDQLKTYAEKSDKEIKTHQKLSEETKASVDKLLSEQSALRAQVGAMEQLIADLDSGKPGGGDIESIGARVAESEAFANFGGSSAKGQFSIPLGAITSDLDSAGALIVPERYAGIIAPQQVRLTVRDLLGWGTAQSNAIEYVRETGFTNSADVVAENPADPKPESDIKIELESAKVATIAHWIRASRQVLDDAGMLAAYIDGRLMYGLKLKEEAQLLKGSGVGLNINGLYTQASAYANPGVTVQSESHIDRLRLAMLQVQLAEYVADGITLNPIDWAAIELTKDKNDQYIIASPNGLRVPSLWGLPVVATTAMATGEFLAGAFKLGAMGWDRENANITVSTEDRDNFVKNMVTILCENRVGLTVFRPEAFVKGDFTFAAGGGGEAGGEGGGD